MIKDDSDNIGGFRHTETFTRKKSNLPLLNEQIEIKGIQNNYLFDIKNDKASLINGVGSHAVEFPSNDRTVKEFKNEGGEVIRQNVDVKGRYLNEKYALMQRLQKETEKDEGFIDQFYNEYIKTKNVHISFVYEKIEEIKSDRRLTKFKSEAYILEKKDRENERDNKSRYCKIPSRSF